MFRVLAIVAVLSVLVAACGSDKSVPGPEVTAPAGVEPARALGAPERRLDLLAPAGYADDETFAAATGCDVRVTRTAGSDDVVRKLSTGRYDGALGTGDATIRLVAAGRIAPVNTALVPNYADVYDGLKERSFNSVGGQQFAVPVGRAVNLLLWRRDGIPGTLGSLGAVLDQAQTASYGGELVVPDDPASIGEAALWVARQREDLKITDPYELDRRQFAAVVAVLRLQRPYVTEYWRSPGAVREAFRAREAVVGLAPQKTVGELQARPDAGPIDAIRPREGSTGVSPAWMIAARAKHPNCMYRWLNRVLDPAVNARMAQRVAIAPANRRSCDVLAAAGDEEHCQLYHADDDGYYQNVLFRTTPSRDCGDARGRVCMGWDAWVKAWASITE